jgi:hypothetical protein
MVADIALGERGALSWISPGSFRFWIDESLVPGRGRLVERALLEVRLAASEPVVSNCFGEVTYSVALLSLHKYCTSVLVALKMYWP